MGLHASVSKGREFSVFSFQFSVFSRARARARRSLCVSFVPAFAAPPGRYRVRPPRSAVEVTWTERLEPPQTPKVLSSNLLLRYQVNPVINSTSGMNRLITINPTARPRNTIINGSINAVRPSVITRTSSSYVSATLYNIVSNSPVSSPTSTMLTTKSSTTRDLIFVARPQARQCRTADDRVGRHERQRLRPSCRHPAWCLWRSSRPTSAPSRGTHRTTPRRQAPSGETPARCIRAAAC